MPGNVAAQAVSSSQVNVSWNASTDNVGVTGYKVFRDGTLVASPTGTSYQDTGRSAGTTYSYTVLARDAAGNESAQSPAVNRNDALLPIRRRRARPSRLRLPARSSRAA